MFLWGTAEDGQEGTAEGPQWALGGDTWVVGCKIPDCVVFPEFNNLNPDESNEIYNSGKLLFFKFHYLVICLFYALSFFIYRRTRDISTWMWPRQSAVCIWA